VGEVAKGTPAEKAGLKARDIIVEVDGEVTRQLSQLVVLKSRKKPGDTIKLRIKRGRAIKEVDVVLDKWEKSLVGL
jgi:serine protease Do